eukprot:scaffold1705_cov304-Prasinococcus_capsulatus_cf.AAC.1
MGCSRAERVGFPHSRQRPLQASARARTRRGAECGGNEPLALKRRPPRRLRTWGTCGWRGPRRRFAPARGASSCRSARAAAPASLALRHRRRSFAGAASRIASAHRAHLQNHGRAAEPRREAGGHADVAARAHDAVRLELPHEQQRLRQRFAQPAVGQERSRPQQPHPQRRQQQQDVPGRRQRDAACARARHSAGARTLEGRARRGGRESAAE